MSESIIKPIRDNWVVLAFAASLIVTWTQFDSRISQNTADIKEMQVQTITTNATLVVLQTNMAEIKATLEFIKNNISR